MDKQVTTHTFGQGGKYTNVTINENYFGYVIRDEYEAAARGSYYPATVTRVRWTAWLNKGGSFLDDKMIGEFKTRKAAIEAIAEEYK